MLSLQQIAGLHGRTASPVEQGLAGASGVMFLPLAVSHGNQSRARKEHVCLNHVKNYTTILSYYIVCALSLLMSISQLIMFNSKALCSE